jgi:small subunit ribosomal protein S16
MPTKIRLSRHGKKGSPFYHIVVADGRAPRDGKFIEKLGTYNPNTNPATIELNTEKAFQWVQKGAQPTDTTRAILSYKGVLYRSHLAKGVAKGAMTQEQADAKFNQWLSQKEGKIEGKKSSLTKQSEEANKKRLAAEAKVKEERAKAIEAKNIPVAETPAEEATSEEASAEETPATSEGETSTEQTEESSEA